MELIADPIFRITVTVLIIIIGLAVLFWLLEKRATHRHRVLLSKVGGLTAETTRIQNEVRKLAAEMDLDKRNRVRSQ